MTIKLWVILVNSVVEERIPPKITRLLPIELHQAMIDYRPVQLFSNATRSVQVGTSLDLFLSTNKVCECRAIVLYVSKSRIGKNPLATIPNSCRV